MKAPTPPIFRICCICCLEILEVKALAGLEFLRQSLRLILIHAALRVLDQRQHVAHAEHARSHAVGIEGFEA